MITNDKFEKNLERYEVRVSVRLETTEHYNFDFKRISVFHKKEHSR